MNEHSLSIQVEKDLKPEGSKKLDKATLGKMTIDAYQSNWGYRLIYDGVKKKRLFSLKLNHRQYLKDGNVNNKLEKGFEDNKHSLSSEAKINKIDEKHWKIVDGAKGYRIKDDGTQLNIYRKKRSWVIGVFIFFGVIFGGYIVASAIDGTFYMPGADRLGFFEDPSVPTMPIVMLGMLLTIKIFYERLSTVFLKLWEKDIIDKSKCSLNEYVEILDESERFISGKDKKFRYKHLFNNKVGVGFKGLSTLYFIGLVFAIYLFIRPFIDHSQPYIDAWNYSGHWSAIAWGTIVAFVGWGYLIPAAFWHFISTIVCIRRIITSLSADGALKLRPLAPDGVAGLRPLGDLTLSMIYVIVVPMITVVSVSLFYRVSWGVFIALLAYLIVVVIIFFLPLSTAHDVMAKAKEEELEMLSEEFNRAYKEFKAEHKSSENTAKRLRSANYMDKIGALYTHVEKMAVWPFDISIVTKFLITILLPFGIIGIQILLDWLIL